VFRHCIYLRLHINQTFSLLDLSLYFLLMYLEFLYVVISAIVASLSKLICINLPSVFPFSSSVNFGNSIDFEIESQIDLGINPKLCKYFICFYVFMD